MKDGEKYQYADHHPRPPGTDPRIVKPYLHRNMLRPRLHGMNNLCSTIRDIYVKTDDEQIKLWCRIAMRMSKNMHLALSQYKAMLNELGVDIKASRTDWQLGKKEITRK